MPIILHGLDLKAPCQLVKIGTVRSDKGPFNPMVACCFAPLVCVEQQQFQRSRDAPRIVLWVPLAHLLALPLGIGVLDGKRIEVGNHHSYSVLVEASASPIYTRRILEAAGVLPRLSLHSSGEDEADIDESLWYEFESLDRRFGRVIAPCTTLFFAYYAPTSPLAMLHLKGEFPKVLSQLERSGSAFREPGTGVCHLVLSREWHASDIPVLARSLFDQSGWAREAAQSIGVHPEIQARSSKPFHIHAVPPFLGATRLRVRACEHVVPSTGERVLIILRIHECSAEFPCSRLEVTLDQPGPNSGKAPGSKDHRGPRKIPNTFDFDFIEIDGVGSRPGTDFAPVTVSGGRGLRYNALTGDNYVITRREVNRTGKTRGKTTGQDPRNSSQRKSSKGDGDSRQTEVTTRGSTDSQEDPGGTSSGRMTPAGALRHTMDGLSSAAVEMPAIVESLLVSPQGLQYGPWVLNRVTHGEGRAKKWETVLKGARPRGILIADVAYEERHAYVIDIVRRIDESFSILILHRPDFGALSNADLLRVFRLIDEAQRLPRDEVLKGDTLLHIHRVMHGRTSGGPHSLSSELGKLLKADA